MSTLPIGFWSASLISKSQLYRPLFFSSNLATRSFFLSSFNISVGRGADLLDDYVS